MEKRVQILRYFFFFNILAATKLGLYISLKIVHFLKVYKKLFLKFFISFLQMNTHTHTHKKLQILLGHIITNCNN